MNIMKTNMLSLDDKRIAKEKAANAAVSAPVLSAVQPQQMGMNALMFQGMQNLMANPKLAQGVGVMNDDAEPQKDETAKSYVAPFSSNVSFQSTKVKSMALAGLLALGAASMTSCKDETWQKTEVIVDLDALVAAQNQTNAYLRELLAQGKINEEKQNAIINAILTFSAQYEKGLMSFEEFKAAVFKYIAEDSAIQKAILQELQNQGMTNKEAIDYFKKAVDKIYAELKAGNLTLEEALDELNKIGKGIDDINALLAKWYNEYVQAVADFKAYAEDFKNQLQAINKNGQVTNAQLTLLNTKAETMVAQNNIQIQALQNIIQNQKELKQITEEGLKILIAQGYTRDEILKMGFAKANELLTEILNKNTSMDAKLAVIIDLINSGKFEEAYKAIEELLQDIKVSIDNLNNTLINFYNQYKKDHAETMEILGGIYKNGQIQIEQINNLTLNVNGLREDLNNIKVTINDLLIEVQKGTEIDYERFEEMFKLLGLQQNASKDEIIAAINDFKNTYIAKEEKEIELLENLSASVNDIKVFLVNNTPDNKDVIEAIMNLTIAVNSGNEDVSDLLKIANQKLDELIKAVNELRADVNKLATAQYELLQQMNVKLGDIEALFPDLKLSLDEIVNNQKAAQKTLQKIYNKMADLEAAIAKLEAMAGQSLTKEDIDDLMGKYGDDLKAFLAGLHAETMDAAKEALEYQKQTLVWLADILDAIKKLDKDAPDYNEKLDAIIELLENFECKCTCDCGDNETIHEGIIEIAD